ncbi:MAG: hypothetical protein H6707_20340 [Deltaproteobacteria bacterium]|nr:hypothetical protein [Deltaproteobacteria bacterium]
MSKFLMVAVVAGALGFALPARAETECGTHTYKVASDIYQQLDKVLKSAGCASMPQCATVAKVNTVVKNMVKFWNWAAQNSWAKIGPRRLDFNTALTGRIVSTGGRLFVSAHPAIKDTVKITIQEIDGKGKTGVAICKTARGGKVIKVANVMFNPNDKAKGNKRERKEVLVNGARSHVISVHFDGKSVGNTLQYTLHAAPQ